ncbi:hypothetical protein K502DRAFT_366640 [Neoconidiobolus thromboides FSU 785]|nr:hypothetical protein K502DRAFT_366640 [Neoconidiobolus thromboides FSU 785]
MKLLNLISFFALVLVSNAADIREDPCATISKKPIFTYEETLACLNNIDLDSKKAEEHIDLLKKEAEFYAFLDIAKDSPEKKISSNVNIIKGLDEIRQKKHQKEVPFHRDIINLFNSLHDGHTVYAAACVYFFTFRQPFPLFTYHDEDGNQIVKVLSNVKFPPAYQEYWLSKGVNVTKYLGKKINLINGQLPLDYLQMYADKNIAGSRDSNSRLNLALAKPINSFGTWGVTYGAHTVSAIVPEKGEVSYTFLVGNDEERVKVPYLVTGPTGYNDTASYYKANCSVNPSERQSSPFNEENKDVERPELLRQQVKQVIETKIDQELPLSKSSTGLNDPLTKGFFVQSYLIKEDTALLNLPTFAPAGVSYFVNETISALKAFKEKKVSKVLIDVSNNGGGIICLGYWLAEYFFPKSNPLYFRTDQRMSPIFNALVKASNGTGGFHDPQSWLKLDGTYFSSPEEFLKGRKFVRGGSEGSYTQLFLDDCPSNPFADLIKENNNESPYKPEDITIISNGVCYSTCTLFSNNLQLVNGVKTVLVGGDKKTEGTVASLAGGTVYSLTYVLWELQRFGLLGTPDSLKFPPFKIALSYTSREAYSEPSDSKSPRPLEFTWIPAKKRIFYTEESLLNPYKLWEQVANL